MVSKNENEQKTYQIEAEDRSNHMGEARKQTAYKRQDLWGKEKIR